MEQENIVQENSIASTNVLTNLVSMVNSGLGNKDIFNYIDELIKGDNISEGIVLSLPDALRSYAENFSKSLNAIAEKMESLSKNAKKVEIQKEADSDIKVEEFLDDYKHDEVANKISGKLKISFCQDMSIYKVGNKMNLKQSAVDFVKKNIFNYFHKEYPSHKAELSEKIFKGNIVFKNVKISEAELNYEIENAY
jgi:hypothetical protein